MRSAFAYLLFCFYCFTVFFDNLIPIGQQKSGQNPLLRPTMLLTFSLYFLAAGLICIGLVVFKIKVEQSFWLSALVISTVIGAYMGGQYLVMHKNRGLLMLEHFAPLVAQNKWIYPVTAALFFLLSFLLFIVGAGLASGKM